MIIRYFECDDKDNAKFISPLIKSTTNLPIPPASELALQYSPLEEQGVKYLDGCYSMVSVGKEILSKQNVHVKKELKSGFFKKKQEYTVVEEVIKAQFVPDIEGVYIVGYLSLSNSTGVNNVISNRHGLNLELDPETRLPKINQPKTIEEAIDLIMVDPRFISSLDPDAEYFTKDAEKTAKILLNAVKSSFVKLTNKQSEYGVEFTEKERNARTKFSLDLLQRAYGFSQRVKESIKNKENLINNAFGG